MDNNARSGALDVASIGLISPLGIGFAPAMAALRAGISALGEIGYADETLAPIMGCRIVVSEDEQRFAQRLLSMLVLAIGDALGQGAPMQLDGLPILIALPEQDRPGLPNGFIERMPEALSRALGLNRMLDASSIVALGHAGGFEAIARARELLKHKDIEACLVCAVDSYIRASTLLWLEDSQRLKVEAESSGIVPGEAAAAVLLVRAGAARPPLLRILGLGRARESIGPLSDEPLMAEGLSTALKLALDEAELALHEVDFRLSDLAGESYGFAEQSLTLARVMRQVRQTMPLWHPAEGLGDVGAAAGLLQLALAGSAFAKGFSPGPVAACFTSSFHGERAVAIVSDPQHG